MRATKLSGRGGLPLPLSGREKEVEDDEDEDEEGGMLAGSMRPVLGVLVGRRLGPAVLEYDDDIHLSCSGVCRRHCWCRGRGSGDGGGERWNVHAPADPDCDCDCDCDCAKIP